MLHQSFEPSRPPQRTIRVIDLSIAIVALSLFCGCSGSTAPDKPSPQSVSEPVLVRLGDVTRRSAARIVEVTGTLFGTEEATISAEVPGRVDSIAHDVGDSVEQDGVLAQLEQTQYALALEQKRAAMLESLAALGLTELPPPEFDALSVPTVARARRQAENAEARYGRAERLWTQQPPLISEQDVSDLRTARDVAKSDADVALLTARATLAAARSRNVEIALAQQRLDDTTIRAPKLNEGAATIDYRVASRMVSVGEYVVSGAALFHLVASNPIKFRCDVPERFVDQVRAGQMARLRVDAFAEPFDGEVTRINPQVSSKSRTFQVEIAVPNQDGRLRAGGFGIATISVGDDADVPFVPADAIITFAGLSKVFSVEGGKAREHRVSLGRRFGIGAEEVVEVVGVPDAVEEIVIRGAQRLATGTPVRVSDSEQ